MNTFLAGNLILRVNAVFKAYVMLQRLVHRSDEALLIKVSHCSALGPRRYTELRVQQCSWEIEAQSM